MSTYDTTNAPALQFPDVAITPQRRRDLHARFREAAAIEHRLIWLEDFVGNPPKTEDSAAVRGRWTVATLRFMQLIRQNPALAPFVDTIRDHLLSIHERGAG